MEIYKEPEIEACEMQTVSGSFIWNKIIKRNNT